MGLFINLAICSFKASPLTPVHSTVACPDNGVQNCSECLCHQQVFNLSGRAKGDGIHWPLKDGGSEYDLTVRLTTYI